MHSHYVMLKLSHLTKSISYELNNQHSVSVLSAYYHPMSSIFFCQVGVVWFEKLVFCKPESREKLLADVLGTDAWKKFKF